MKDLKELNREELLLEQQKTIDQIYHLDKRHFDPRHRELYLKLNKKFNRIESRLKYKEEED